ARTSPTASSACLRRVSVGGAIIACSYRLIASGSGMLDGCRASAVRHGSAAAAAGVYARSAEPPVAAGRWPWAGYSTVPSPSLSEGRGGYAALAASWLAGSCWAGGAVGWPDRRRRASSGSRERRRAQGSGPRLLV